MSDFLPIWLAYGEICVYRIRMRSTFNRIKAPQDFNWASVYQISPYGIQHAQVGQSVLFNGKDIICQLAFGGNQYPVIEEAKIVTTENH